MTAIDHSHEPWVPTPKPRRWREEDYGIEVVDEADYQAFTDARPTGSTRLIGWLRKGVVAVAIVAAILLALQWFGGNTGTETLPGPPSAEVTTGR